MLAQNIPPRSAAPGVYPAQDLRFRSAIPNLSTTGPDAFEPGVVSSPNARSDPRWVENNIAGDQLSKQPPWTYTLTYSDHAKLVIPLEQVFMEPLPAATVVMFRRHKGSGRIVPCVISQSDPRLKSLKGPAGRDLGAIADLATPRFDAQTAPQIVSLVNMAHWLSLGKGIAEVIQLQTMNPLMAGGVGRTATGAAIRGFGGGAAEKALTVVEIGAGDLKASIELAKRGGVRVIAVDPVRPAAAAVQELQRLGGQFVEGVAADIAPGTADQVFQYFPYPMTGRGLRYAQGGTGTFSLVSDTVRLLKPGGAAQFVTEDISTAEFLAKEASQRGLRAVITKWTAGAAALGASGMGIANFSKSLAVLMVNIYK
jgi:hypothetical protein